MDGGGGGGGGPSQSTVTNTNIPEYARPYVETMLGATQQQLFHTRPTAGAYDPATGQTGPGGTEITGIKPFQAFGREQFAGLNYDPSTGMYNAAYTRAGLGKGEMEAAQAAVAEQDPLQQKAYRTAAGMQTPGAYGQALESAQTGIGQALSAGEQYGQMATSPEAMKSYMSPYMQNVVDTQKQALQRDADIKSAQLKGQAIQQGRFGGSRTALEQAQLNKDLAGRMDLAQAMGLQNAFQNAQQAQQFQSTLGLQGAQAGTGGASQLAGIAGQQLGAEQGILGLQSQMGAQQQAQRQQVINQALLNYANTQQYPQQQLSFMNAMLRGLPMQSTTTQSYQAAPSAMSQLAGLGTAGYGAYKMFGSKKGGVIRDKKPAGLAALALDKMGA